MGAFPRRHRLSLPLWRPRGACLFGCLSPLPLACLSAPYPPNPLPRRGRGRPKLFFARGSAPCIPSIRPPAALVRPAAVENSMVAFPRRHRLSLPLWRPRGACLFWLPVAPAFSFVFAPIPPTPFPAGRGRPKLFHARGFAPCIPATEPGRHLQNQPSGCPEWGFAPCIPGAEPKVRRKNDRKRFPMSSAGSQGEGGPGERNFGV